MSTKIPKVMNFYWDGSNMSYLHYMSIISFHKLNPDWKIIINEPTNRTEKISWTTPEQKLEYTGRDYYERVKKLSFVNLKKIDFNEIGFNESVPEIYKSDFLRWHILSTDGGGWSDFDILYVKPLKDLIIDDKSDTFVCIGREGHIIGFFLSKPNNSYFKHILNSVKTDFNQLNYQSIGATLLNSIYPNIETILNLNPDINLFNLDMDIFYLFDHHNLHKIFNFNKIDEIKSNTIGIHWYNGSDQAKIFNNIYRPGSNEIKNTITELIKNII